MPEPFRSGYVSLIGRPNVGKSTLLNVLLGQKIAIVSEKPQTTRNRIIGIKTLENAQIIFIDTPGMHRPRNLLGEYMMRTAREVLAEVDLVLFITEPGDFFEQDRAVLDSLGSYERPVMLLINKIDTVRKEELLLVIDRYRNAYPFEDIIPVSALKEDGIDLLVRNVIRNLPEGPQYYPGETVTEQVERFIVAEIIREKIMEKTSEEIPFSAAVEIQEWTERDDGVIMIDAMIYVEREGQKGIIIGKAGRMLKMIGTLARKEMELLLDTKVFLRLWVKVKKGWRDNQQILRNLGYH